ncbi:MAG TPA: hypothetical protein VHR18_06595 [Solirubrobacterales bacterium]|jgi:hypothetical protein|nr:hypothetical protein [Solirubrobacterales bacterium]
MIVIALAALVGAVLPEAEYPWPERIGISFPFTIAGGLGVAAGALPRRSTPAARDRATRIGSFIGFWVGSVIFWRC